jgi:gamma-glutamyltranspeptidase/glutathione hydrolase
MQPAVELAERGYVLTAADANILDVGSDDFAKQPNVADIFLPDGQTPGAGERLVQEELATTLKLIAEQGPDAFYKGPIARAIVDASTRNGGILTMKDFADYTVEETEPVQCSYRGYEVLSSAPPSSGGTTICLILNVLEGYPMRFLGFNSSASLHLMVEAMRHAFVDRNTQLGDPSFVDNPLERLLSDRYAAEIRARIKTFSATPSAMLSPGVAPHEEPNTTHVSIVDKHGNAVSFTYTINSYFGSRRIAGDTGFFLNNEMDDFTAKPGTANMFGLIQGKRNAVAPGKRPLSSMSPTLVKKDGKTFLVLGSPGGSRIISIVVQGIVNVIDHGMNISEAVNAPRIHHQWLPDKVFAEPRAINRDTLERLEGAGHTITVQRSWGAMEAIMVVPQTSTNPESPIDSFADDTTKGAHRHPGTIYGVNDSRRPAGLAVGR